MGEFEFGTYLVLGFGGLMLNAAYAIYQGLLLLSASNGKAALCFALLFIAWIGLSLLVAAFIVIVSMAHSNAAYYTRLARIAFLAYPMIGVGYFLLQRRIARRFA